MQLDFWHERWEKNQIGFHIDTVNPLLKQHWSQVIEQDNKSGVFVPLCGKSHDLLWLTEQGHPVLGIEISAVAVRDFFTENNLTPHVTQQGKFEAWQYNNLTLLVGDFFDLTTDDLKDCLYIYDRASLIALPPTMRPDYAQHLTSISSANKVLLITLDYPQDEMKGPPFSVSTQNVNDYYQQHFNIVTLASNDALDANANFKKRGVSQLNENVFLLTKQP